MSDDDPVTGRRFLTESAYADDRHIRSRMGIWAYAQAPLAPGWRTTCVLAWDGTQVVADVGCGNGFDLRQLVPQGRCAHAYGIDLSAGMLRSQALADLLPTGRLTLIQGDAQRLPVRDECIDVALCMHMLYHVADLPAAVSELRRIVRPGGTLLASTTGADTLAEVNDLLEAAVSRQLGRRVRATPASSFTTGNGGPILATAFAEVTLHGHEVPLAFPGPEPVVAYIDSVREPTLAHIGEPLDFDAVLDDIAARVERVVAVEGAFRTTSRMGVFVCR